MPDNDEPLGQGPFGRRSDTPSQGSAAERGTRSIIGRALGGEDGRVNGTWNQDPVPGEKNDNDIPPGNWIPNYRTGLPEDCPVKPLGHDDSAFYFLTNRGTVSILSGNKSSKAHITTLFAGRSRYLAWAWPPSGKRDATRWNVDAAFESLIDGAEAMGPWSPSDKIRGRGAWLDEYGNIIWHAGDKVLTSDGWNSEREIGFHLYPAGEKLPKPSAESVSESPGGGADNLLETLKSWNWTDQDLMPTLMLGQIGCMFLGGALFWRPHGMLTGKKGCGKTTLQGVVRNVMGGAVFACSAVKQSAAGIYQTLQADTISVAIDEVESSLDDRKLQGILDLARAGSSGDKFSLGGQDHKSHQYNLRSCFLLSGINPPALSSQDSSRFIHYKMNKRTAKDKERSAETRADVLAGWGRDILRRMIDHWGRFNEVMLAYQNAMKKHGDVDQRFCDQYGPLVAAYHVLMYDSDPAPNELEHMGKTLAALYTEQNAGQGDNWQDCLEHLLDRSNDLWRELSARTVRALLYKRFGVQAGDGTDHSTAFVRKKLSQIGCSLVFDKGEGETAGHAWLFIPKKHPNLSMLFHGTSWGSGKWHNLLEQAPDDIIKRGVNAKIGGVTRYGHKIRLSACLDVADPEDGGG